MPLTFDACAAQHIGDREEQQDRLAILTNKELPEMLLAVVADGMGGHTGGAMAAQQVIDTARQLFLRYSPSNETPEQLLAQIIKESHLVITLASVTSEMDPHSTVVALLLTPTRAIWAHTGDSRIYHFCGRQVMSRSADHSYVQKLIDMGFITEEERETHPKRNLLMSCLGGEEEPEIRYGKSEPVFDKDAFILCSDGLWAYFSDAEMAQILAENTPRQAAEILINGAREKAGGRGDNVSLIALKVTQVKKAAAKPPLPGGVLPGSSAR